MAEVTQQHCLSWSMQSKLIEHAQILTSLLEQQRDRKHTHILLEKYSKLELDNTIEMGEWVALAEVCTLSVFLVYYGIIPHRKHLKFYHSSVQFWEQMRY